MDTLTNEQLRGTVKVEQFGGEVREARLTMFNVMRTDNRDNRQGMLHWLTVEEAGIRVRWGPMKGADKRRREEAGNQAKIDQT